MEWIEGTKLTDVQTNANTNNDSERQESVKENLDLVKVAIDSTLSQLLVTGILHADPHAG
jgi:predicted unusual protein kinase regulating ubiquinone biosynthesis (AarF/ABC1/UbiB family)